MSEFKIGAPKIGNGKSDYEKYFGIEPGDNYYRILPPCYAYADSGKWGEFYATHKVQTANGIKNFICIEEKDRKTKLITKHCPNCDRYYEALKFEEQMKAQNATKEQLKEFNDTILEFLKPNKAFYVNAMKQDGKMSVLPIKYKLFKGVENLQKKVFAEEGLNFVDVQGAFLCIKKIQAFKGDRDTTYSVDLATRKVNIDGRTLSETMLHQMTDAEITEFSRKARDLSKLFKSLTAEEMVSLLNSEGAERQALIDRFWSKPEPTETQPNTGLESKIAGTNVTAVSRLEIQGGAPAIVTPGAAQVSAPAQTMPAAAAPAQATPAATTFQFKPSPAAQAPAAQPSPAAAPAVQQAPVQAPTQSAPPANFRFGGGAPAAGPKTVTSLSDQDFMAAFKARK